jgi:molybdopterin molybdotransferase
MMLTVDEALARVLEATPRLPDQLMPVEQASGRMLAESIVSDIDSPPYDKSVVDGFALRAADVAAGLREFRVAGEITAGDWPRTAVEPGEAIRIMTGAPLPAGVDAVVMIEHTDAGSTAPASPSTPGPSGTATDAFPPAAADRWAPRATVRLDGRPVSAGQNIMRRAASLAFGSVVLKAGRLIRPIEVGLLSEVGCVEVRVVPKPRVAVLSTGNELVPPSLVPTRGQIRNSNGPMLAALAEQAGGLAVPLGIARDDRESLRQRMLAGLEADVMVLSGGVSAGALDLVPSVLEELGVVPRFHQVRLRPGKPLWFGARVVGDRTTLVFGLPGNPVSSLVCWNLFVRPALEQMQGRPADGLATARGWLEAPRSFRGDRPTYWPAVFLPPTSPPVVAESARSESARFESARSESARSGSNAEANADAATSNAMSVDAARATADKLGSSHERPRIRLLDWQGSADLRTLADANCLAFFPPGNREYTVDDPIDVRLL